MMKILSTLRTLRSVILNLDIRYFVNKKVLLKTSKYKIFQNCSLSVDVVNSKARCTAPLAMSPPPHSVLIDIERNTIYNLQPTNEQNFKMGPIILNDQRSIDEYIYEGDIKV